MTQMQYRRLGRSGMKVSSISLGSWLTYGGHVEQETAISCIDRAYELGINFFDTANVYMRGEAEKVVGKALAKYQRDSYVLATKGFGQMGDGPNDHGLSRKHIIEQVNHSLKRLNVDYIDLWQCHRYDTETPLDETLRAIDDLITQGKILYAGVSEWSAVQISDALHTADKFLLDRIVSNQPQYSMLERYIEKDIIPLCEREGIGQVVWSPLAEGVLSEIQAGRSDPGGHPCERRKLRQIYPWQADRVQPEQSRATPSDRCKQRLLARATGTGLDFASTERFFGDHRRIPPGSSQRKRACIGRGIDTR